MPQEIISSMSPQDRKKTFLIGIASGYLSKGVAVVVALIAVPLGLHYFGPIKYGLWVVISSILAYVELSQFGVNTATSVLIAKEVNADNQRSILRHTVILLSLFAVGVFVILWTVIYFYAGWVRIFGDISLPLRGEAAGATSVLVLFFLLRLPTLAFTSAFVGLQQVFWERFYASLSTFIRLIALLVTVRTHGSLFTIAFFTGMGNLLVGIVSGFHLLIVHRHMRIRLTEAVEEAPSVKYIFGSAMRFFIIGIAAMIVWSTDNLLISFFLGPEQVTAYAVTFRLFTFSFALFTVFNGAISPMYGKAIGQWQLDWVASRYKEITFFLPIVSGLVWIGGIGFARDFICLWTGPSGYGGMLVVLALGGYGYCISLINSHATVLTALNATHRMIWIGWAEAGTNLVISLILIHFLGIGGVALGTLLGALLTGFWLLPQGVAIQTGGRVQLHYRSILKHATIVLFPALVIMYLLNSDLIPGLTNVFMKIAVLMLYLLCSWCVLDSRVRERLSR